MATVWVRAVGLGAPATQFATGEDLLNRVRSDYEEMPGLQLTLRQASRLWNLEPDLTGALLATLIDDGFLVRTRHGRYRRSGTDG